MHEETKLDTALRSITVNQKGYLKTLYRQTNLPLPGNLNEWSKDTASKKITELVRIKNHRRTIARPRRFPCEAQHHDIVSEHIVADRDRQTTLCRSKDTG